MFQTQVHLFMTHLPVFGSLLGGLVLVHGIYKRSNPTKIAAYNLFIVSAIGACIVYYTGAAAQKSIENISGLSDYTISQHKYYGTISLLVFLLLGIVSVIGLFITKRGNIHSKWIANFIFLVALICFGLTLKTSLMGNKIRHTELNKIVPFPPQKVIDEE